MGIYSRFISSLADWLIICNSYKGRSSPVPSLIVYGSTLTIVSVQLICMD